MFGKTRDWTKEEDLYIFKNWQLYTSKEIAKKLTRKKEDVRSRIKFLKLREENDVNDSIKEEGDFAYKTFYCHFIKSYCQGLLVKQVAEYLGVSPATITKARKVLNIAKIKNR